ncbi:MAG: hypothetical protein HYZ37_04425 [Candidatus Solibacter usitatus]|nr:hypothetical protein [Candidatus Solibacter usitatus]
MSLKYAVIDRWSQGQSVFHRLDARMKMTALLVYLLSIATLKPVRAPEMIAFGVLILIGMTLSALPIGGFLLRGAVVLPFTGTFAAISAFGGQTDFAVGLVAKSYLSALGVLLLAATTPMPALLHAAQWLKVPRVLLLVIQFLYRYLFILVEQAGRMRQAALCRGSALSKRSRGERMSSAAGMLSVLFARSYERAEGIQRAMLSRGFHGQIPLLTNPAARLKDWAFALCAVAATLAIRLGGRL